MPTDMLMPQTEQFCLNIDLICRANRSVMIHEPLTPFPIGAL
jgi:hypothetical protein